MEKKMENDMEALGPFKEVHRDITLIMENQMENKMDNEMETGGIYLDSNCREEARTAYPAQC